MPDIILVSGGFDPIHSGHIKLINDANKYGDVVVLLNSDEWLRNKKGKEFLSFDERKIIMQNIKGVLDVLDFDDSDQSCVDGILKAKNLFQATDFPGLDKPAPLMRTPVELSETPGEIRHRAPQLGEHTDAILTEIGYNASEIAELRSKRIV